MPSSGLRLVSAYSGHVRATANAHKTFCKTLRPRDALCEPVWGPELREINCRDALTGSETHSEI